MNQSSERIKYLYQQWLDGNITPSEVQELFDGLNDSSNDGILKKEIEDLFEQAEPDASYDPSRWQYLVNKITLPDTQVIQMRHRNRFKSLTRIAAAAILIVLAGALLFTLKSKDNPTTAKNKNEVKPVKKDLVPGGNKAILTLSNGSQIILDSTADGKLATEENVRLVKMGGQLAYSAETKSSEVVYNTVSTPMGGQYQLVLEDGSKVWLNAGSSLHFPIAFTGKERTVELTGEGYFEIAHNAEKPFTVKVNHINVRVLGTHFNINAYADEGSVRTTLLEGLVSINSGSANLMLQPGQQAEIDGENKVFVNKDVDTDEVIAWKNGWFNFNSLRVQDILRQISRWYNVQIRYEGEPTQKHFSGMVSRNSNVSEVLRIMEQAGIRFKIEGKTIIVLQ